MAIITILSSSSSPFLTTLPLHSRTPCPLSPPSSSSSCSFCSSHHTHYPSLATTSGRRSSNRSIHVQMDPISAASTSSHASSASTAVDAPREDEEEAEFEQSSRERNHFAAMAEEVLQLILAAEEVCSVDETSCECAAAWDEVQARLRIVASNPPSSIS